MFSFWTEVTSWCSYFANLLFSSMLPSLQQLLLSICFPYPYSPLSEALVLLSMFTVSALVGSSYYAERKLISVVLDFFMRNTTQNPYYARARIQLLIPISARIRSQKKGEMRTVRYIQRHDGVLSLL